MTRISLAFASLTIVGLLLVQSQPAGAQNYPPPMPPPGGASSSTQAQHMVRLRSRPRGRFTQPPSPLLCR